MKKLLLATLLAVPGLTFAQSYLILANGVTLTTDLGGFVYDYTNNILTHKVDATGGQYLIEEGRLVHFNDNGGMIRTDFKVKPKIKGDNYFIASDNTLVTITSENVVVPPKPGTPAGAPPVILAGAYAKFSNESFRKKIIPGGNYFIVEMDEKTKAYDLYTVNSKGLLFKPTVEGLKASEIAVNGGNYFRLGNGTIYTVSKAGIVTSRSVISTLDPVTGFPVLSPWVKVAAIDTKKMGSNYFFDINKDIFTIAADGTLIYPPLAFGFNVANIVKFGTNYMIDNEGKVFTVDAAGKINNRTITAHDVRNVKVTSQVKDEVKN